MRALTAVTLALSLVLLASPFPASADTITVDVNLQGDYSSIFLGLYWSLDGDTILVYPGEYAGVANRDLTWPDKNVTLVSRDGPATTVIRLEGYPGYRITGSQTAANVIDGFTFDGGGVYIDYGVRVDDGAGSTIRNCIFVERANVELEGWGVRNLQGCEFRDQKVAVDVDDYSQVSVRDCTFEDNTYAVSFNGSEPANEAILVGCDFVSNSDAVVIGASGYVLVDSCSFSNSTSGPSSFNTGTSINVHAGIFDHVVISNCEFTGNHSTKGAGAVEVYVADGYVELSDCLFEDNTAEEAGGAIESVRHRVKVIDCTFRRNSARTGGAIATGIEGGVGLADIVDCVFEENVAVEGGAIAALHEYNAISGCEFRENAADMGGAIFGRNNHTRISDCRFTENIGHIWGGGVCFMDVREGNAVRIDDSTFDGNRARRGAAVMLDNSIMEMGGCTLYGNRSDDASMVFTRLSDVDVQRSIISFAHQGASARSELESVASISNCVIFGNAGGDSLSQNIERRSDNLFTDPLFCNISQSDYTVCLNSACLPDNNPWSVHIGAYDVGCGACTTPVQRTTWSAVKAMYR